MEGEPRDSEQKKPYEPPRLVAVSLRPEEAVLGHCKTMRGGGPSTSCAAVGTCHSLGS